MYLFFYFILYYFIYFLFISEFDTPGLGFFPSVSSLKIILSLDPGLKFLKEGECDSFECEILNKLNKKSNGGDSGSESDSGSDGISNHEPNELLEVEGSDLFEKDVDDEIFEKINRESTETYVLFTVSDVKSDLPVEPRRGLFDSIQESEVQDPGSFM